MTLMHVFFTTKPRFEVKKLPSLHKWIPMAEELKGTFTPKECKCDEFCLQTRLCIRAIPSYSKPQFQSEAKCKTIDMKMNFILKQIKVIFTRKVMHLASFWKGNVLEFGNGLLHWNNCYLYLCHRTFFGLSWSAIQLFVPWVSLNSSTSASSEGEFLSFTVDILIVMNYSSNLLRRNIYFWIFEKLSLHIWLI